ncbi:MAG: hypothetical protein HY831_03500 [Candidatus Aenigmarchaeota archaeon]|nr:hypothetical protein [Candidatus Aenigmarchaeota archaeon]
MKSINSGGNPGNLCLQDYIDINENIASYAFYTEHPTYEERRRKFLQLNPGLEDFGEVDVDMRVLLDSSIFPRIPNGNN